MTYTEKADRVTLEMSREEFARLMYELGFGLSAAINERSTYEVHTGFGLSAAITGKTQLFRHLRLVNQLNAGNPHFQPYEIPENFGR
jgi:hypothetical protein